ncbi:MAG TPA: CHRD domain-containing protein [Gemmatimonadaceae bacterium]|jgi:Cu/Zn superoxide dismutase
MKLQILGITASVALLAAWTHPAPAVPQATRYTVDMKAAEATPPVPGNAGGHATLTVSGNTVHYQITVNGLSGPATMAHIHVGQAGVAGPPVYTFKINKVGSGTLAEGTIDLTKPASKTVSGDSLKVLLNNGSAYINVHTAAHPGGEIRGQIVKE